MDRAVRRACLPALHRAHGLDRAGLGRAAGRDGVRGRFRHGGPPPRRRAIARLGTRQRGGALSSGALSCCVLS